MSCANRYTVYGALFGACFPVGSVVFLQLTGASGDTGFAAAFFKLHQQHPLLYVIDTAPLFLGLFARLAGLHQDRILALNAGLQQQVEEKTESLRIALEKANQTNAVISHMADYDALTGLFNRRRFQEELEHWIEYGRRYQHGCALIFMDIDDFKSINDDYGHNTGDACLRAMADLAKGVLRSSDVVARWGGDELIALLPETSIEQATALVERLLGKIAETRVACNGNEIGLSASIGIALFPDHARSAIELIACADKAMYEAKNTNSKRYALHVPEHRTGA